MSSRLSHPRRVPRGIITGCLLAACSGLPGGAAPIRDLTRPLSARQVLERVLAAEERVPFAARQTVVISNHGKAEATVTDEINFGRSRSRVTYVLPESARGRIVIRDGKRRRTIEPSTRTVIESEIIHRPVSTQRAVRIANQVARSYNVNLASEAPIVVGRPTFVLTLDPKARDRQKRVWWVDRQTGLILKREMYRPDGALEQSTSLSNLSFKPGASGSVTKAPIPRGYRIVRRRSDGVVTDIAAARRLLGSFGNIPDSLGDGFEFQSASVVDARGARSLHVQYSDGLAGVSLFKIPAHAKIRGPGDDRSRVVTIGTSRGTMVDSVAPYRVLTWEAAGATFNLVSDVADSTIIALAQAVRF
jgi:outer membrane lipoprotein-sorting protein